MMRIIDFSYDFESECKDKSVNDGLDDTATTCSLYFDECKGGDLTSKGK